MNWISFVKDYQSKNNISFKKAMKEAAPSYRKMKEGTVEPNKKIKIIKDKKEPVKKKVIKIVKDKKEPVKKKVIKIVKDKKEEPNKELKKKVLKLVKDNKKNKSKVKETQKIGLDLASKLASKIGIRENISSDFITQQLLKIKKEQEERMKKEKGLKSKCEKAEEQAGKLYNFLKDLDEYDDVKGLKSKKIQEQFPKWEKIYKEDIYPLIQYVKGRGDAKRCDEIMGEGYEENLRNIQSYWNKYQERNKYYKIDLENEAKKKAKREEKKKAKSPAKK
jgi:hypothetical protein